MICSNCHNENNDTANFCANCGVKLSHACPNCGTPTDPSANFCANCGYALRSAPPQIQPVHEPVKPSSYTPAHLAKKILKDRKLVTGERRTVTVLFIDIVGSTALGELLDPEDVYTLTQDALQHMMDAVHLYEGTVAGFRGDGILALFGAPIAHEDTARRAVAAALEMQRSLKEFAQGIQERFEVDLRFRVGLNTGRVVVGHIGDDLDIEFTAIGDTVNLGARMESAAEPGTVYVTGHTYRAAQEYFDFEPIGPLLVKGKTESVLVYKVLGERSLRTRFEAATERGLTPYIGRQHELDLLRRHLEQVKTGRGQVVLINGEAGIGKSRLLLEFHRSIQDEATWLEGQCISYGKNIPYRPIIDIVKHAFHIEEGDSEERIIQKVEDVTAAWDQNIQETIPYLKSMLSADPGDPVVFKVAPRDRRVRMFEGLRALLLQESSQRPLVILVEDLHWIDDQSEAALKTLIDDIATSKILLLLTYRPGYIHSLGERTYFDRIALSDLRPEQSAALAQGMLHQTNLPKELASLITAKAEGNPFYIEEVTRSLVEMGALRRDNGRYSLTQPVEAIRVPDTIQEIILSRIDRLESEAKGALQLASVIGREFTARLLERISDLQVKLDEVLEELKALELIYQEAYFPELSFMFKHALTQDVAYRTLLRERRKRLHRLIGTAIEELYKDRLSEQVEMLAYHYYEGEAWEKALEYLVKAGDKVADTFANQEALAHYARALEVCQKLGPSTLETAADVARKRGMLNQTTGNLQAANADFNHMRISAQSLSDNYLEGLALSHLGLVQMMGHDPSGAEESFKSAISLPGKGLDNIYFFASQLLAHTLKIYNQHERAEPYYKMARELAPKVNDRFILSWWKMTEPAWFRWEGYFDKALERHQQDIADDTDIKSFDLYPLWFKSLTLGSMGEYQQALALLDRILSTCERIGENLISVRVLNSVGWIYGELQDHKRAMEWNSRGIMAAQEAGFPNPEVESNARLNLGDNLMAVGRLDEAEEQFQEVEQVVRNPRPQDMFMLWRYSQHLFHSYGELWLTRGHLDKAFAYANECLALSEKSNSQKNIVKARRLRGQIFMAEGKLSQTESELSTALEMAQRVKNPPQLWLTYVVQGDLFSLQEREEDAQSAFQHAIQVIQQVADNLTDLSLRETFLNSESILNIITKLNSG